MKRIFLIASLYAMGTFAAQAEINIDGLVAQYQAEGYTRIEVTKGLTQTKVEAIKDGVVVEVIYDSETGAVLKSETDNVEADDNTAPGVRIRERARDFVDGTDDDEDDDSTDDSDDSDESDDDSNDEGDDDSNDEGDDDNGSDDGSDEGDDDNSGSDDNGGDDGSDEGNDDNGGDDSDEGGDDNGGDDSDEGGDDNGGDDDSGEGNDD